MQPTDFEELLILSFIFVIGLSFGSFVTLISYRIPQGKDVIFTPSHCPSCKHNLGFFDLFPIISWCLRGGKCSYCGTAIAARYPLIELSVGLLFVFTYLMHGLSWQFIVISLLGICLVTVIVTDLEYKIIPDQLQIAMLVLGIFYRLYPDNPNLSQLFLGPILGVGSGLLLRYVFSQWKKQEALGLGDVKFLATVGIFLEYELIITFLFLSGMIGIITSLLWSAVGKGRQFPFGPALAVSLYFCLVLPDVQGWVREYIISMMQDY